jgi:predicted double-glycine peptidase
MILTVEVPPDVEAGLLAQAEAQGLDVPRFVENLIYRQVMEEPTAEVFRPAVELTFEERREHLRKFIEGHAGNTVVLSDEAMSRESIYEDRGL